MDVSFLKKILSLFIVTVLCITGFYIYSHYEQPVENNRLVTLDMSLDNQKNTALKQKIITDFESAFLKQYTPLVGCEVFHEKELAATCKEHKAQAKNEFKAEYIKSRGLPKNTFEELKLSFNE